MGRGHAGSGARPAGGQTAASSSRRRSSGLVANRLVEPGQAVQAGQPLVSLLPEGSVLQAQLLVPSRAIGFIEEGDRVLLRYQAYPYQKFGHHVGRVVRISRSALGPGGGSRGQRRAVLPGAGRPRAPDRHRLRRGGAAPARHAARGRHPGRAPPAVRVGARAALHARRADASDGPERGREGARSRRGGAVRGPPPGPRARGRCSTASCCDLPDDDILERFAWAVPGARDRGDLFLPRARTLHAERYGGEGLGFHGGGVRVGSEAELQIKGIGQNPLAGEGSLADYTHGGMSLFEGIQEAIWGEVLARALPHGAVRSPAVLATGSPCWWVIDRWGESSSCAAATATTSYLPRGLLVRESRAPPGPLRARHHAPPARGAGRDVPPDAARVRRRSRALPDALPLPSPDAPRGSRRSSGSRSAPSRWPGASPSRARRPRASGSSTATSARPTSAWTAAGSTSARSPRCPAGATSAATARSGTTARLREHVLRTLCFNLRKYFPAGGAALPDPDELIDEYLRVHAAWLERRFLGLTGLPFELLDGEDGGRSHRAPPDAWSCRARGHGAPSSRATPTTTPTSAATGWARSSSRRRAGGGRPRSTRGSRAHLASASCAAACSPRTRRSVARARRRGRRPRRVAARRCRRLSSSTPPRPRGRCALLYRAHMVKHTEAHGARPPRHGRRSRAAAEAWMQDLSDQASVVYEDPAGLTDDDLAPRRRRRPLRRAARTRFFVRAAGGEARPAGARARRLGEASAGRRARVLGTPRSRRRSHEIRCSSIRTRSRPTSPGSSGRRPHLMLQCKRYPATRWPASRPGSSRRSCSARSSSSSTTRAGALGYMTWAFLAPDVEERWMSDPTRAPPLQRVERGRPALDHGLRRAERLRPDHRAPRGGEHVPAPRRGAARCAGAPDGSVRTVSVWRRRPAAREARRMLTG